MPTLYLQKLQFSSLFASCDVSNCKIQCQLLEGLPFKYPDFIGLFNFEWHIQNVIVLWSDREKLILVLHFYRPQMKFAKVMFLHMSVCPRGVYPSMPCRFPGPHPRGSLRGLARGGSTGPHPGEVVSQHALRQTPLLTATAERGTHSTGMHSCCLYFPVWQNTTAVSRFNVSWSHNLAIK